MGWAPIGERTRRVPTQQLTHKFNVIPAISTLGIVAHMIQEEIVTRDNFEFYLENILVILNIIFVFILCFLLISFNLSLTSI